MARAALAWRCACPWVRVSLGGVSTWYSTSPATPACTCFTCSTPKYGNYASDLNMAYMLHLQHAQIWQQSVMGGLGGREVAARAVPR